MGKKMMPVIAAVLALMIFAAGCGASGQAGSTSTPGSGKEQTLTGTLDEVKDFMFVVTDGNGDSYAFPYDYDQEGPEGLSDVRVGDQVTVTYTGELSVVDSFTGEVLSIEKAD